MKENYFHALKEVKLERLVKEEYRTYQIYTLMDRAIPYLADGLKPGQRRILYTLYKNQTKGLVKVSAATGLVLTLHPHGPASIESAIVNMAQNYTFSNNYPLIDKKGYFGERLETAPAAGRYIECRIGEVAKKILFDDLNQVNMIPNYDETVTEPASLLPKLPVMLMNGAEGIGTGFSSMIPSFHHKDICDSMIQYIETGKSKKIKPWVNYFSEKIISDKGKFYFEMNFENKNGNIIITELPKGYDATKLYRHLNKFIESDFIKDYIDNSVDNDIEVELIFKRGVKPSLKEVREKMRVKTSLSPNYTLINENGVKIFTTPDEIITIFTKRRLEVVKRRYELLAIDVIERLTQNNEIIKFIKNKEYVTATKTKNRKAFVEYLEKKKYKYAGYLADMAIYRMTKEEVKKRKILIDEDKIKLKEYNKIVKSDRLIRKKLIEEIKDVRDFLTSWLKKELNIKKEIKKRLLKNKRKSIKRKK